jgi:hypothetical protein
LVNLEYCFVELFPTLTGCSLCRAALSKHIEYESEYYNGDLRTQILDHPTIIDVLYCGKIWANLFKEHLKLSKTVSRTGPYPRGFFYL